MDGLDAASFGETGICGVLRIPLAEIATPGGPVLRMVRAGEAHFLGCGEVYFSEVEPGAIKAWKRHTRQTQQLTVPRGRIRVVLHDQRADSPTADSLLVLELGRPDSYALLRIPPGVCYGFAALGAETALICNCPDLPHDPAESSKLPLDSPSVPYSW